MLYNTPMYTTVDPLYKQPIIFFVHKNNQTLSLLLVNYFFSFFTFERDVNLSSR